MEAVAGFGPVLSNVKASIRTFDEAALLKHKKQLLEQEKAHKDDYLFYYLLGLCCEGLCSIYFQQERKDDLKNNSIEGKQYLQRSIELKADIFESHRALGQTAGYACKGDPFTLMQNVSVVEGELKTAESLVRTPEDQKAYVLWQCYKMIATPKLFGGDPEGAIRKLEEIQKDEPCDIALAYQGLALNAMKKKNEAKVCFRKAKAINDHNLIATVNLGEK